MWKLMLVGLGLGWSNIPNISSPPEHPEHPDPGGSGGLPIPTGLLGHLLPRRRPWVNAWCVECALLVTENSLSR